MDQSKEKLYKQVCDAGGNVQYTYVAHWCIVNRLKRYNWIIKIAQIVLTSISTGGFLALLTAQNPYYGWIGCGASALSLGLNLYTLNFKLADEISQHTSAANALWKVRESYNALITDFDDMTNEQIREKRDELTESVNQINQCYDGTDNNSFGDAKKQMWKYQFEEGESANLLNVPQQLKEDNASGAASWFKSLLNRV